MAFDAKAFLATLTSKPGVYRMFSATGEILYVGKAKNLKKRVSSYFGDSQRLSPKNRALVLRIQHIEITATHTETEALLLEHNLIKQWLPPYNILLRDDKSYPFIYLSNDEFPRLGIHRGAKHAKGRYFGPYPNGRAVYESLNLLQKLFPVRQCSEVFYRNRSRPCLQHQIKRCTAPCVGLISPAQYQEAVRHAVLFLEGKSLAVIESLVEKMNAAAAQLAYEQAALYRDQITRLRHIQERQYMDTEGHQNLDVVACLANDGIGCVQVLSIRDGRHLGSQAYFPIHTQDASAADILDSFLPQYYLAHNRDLPSDILLNLDLAGLDTLAAALHSQLGRTVHFHRRVRGTRAHWLAMAEDNAQLSLAQRRPSQHRERLSALAVALQLEELPQRLECFDISHTGGEATLAACVVFDLEGPRPSDYRRYNIQDIQPGDDYAAMHQALQRRYRRVREEAGPLPDILLVDGGKGQLAQAQAVLEELQLSGVLLIGVAKGPTRQPGLETLFLPDDPQPLILPKESPALHLIQQIRDEAHRFAITGHRQRRAKARKVSVLEDIAGIGPRRRRQLITYFGGLQGIQRAGVEDLSKVPGISQALAHKIYAVFHE